MSSLRYAWAFLTRLPGGRHPDDQQGLTAAVPWFPVVGLIIGAIAAVTYVGLSELLSPFISASITFALTALLTGGFHEDGLADSLDGLAGGWNREQRLEILKDSRHGTFGVLALVFISLIKVSALAELDGQNAALSLVAAHGAARAGAVALMGTAPPAATEGLGADYSRSLRPLPAATGTIIGIAALVAAYGAKAPIVIVAVGLGVAAVGGWSHRKVGGVNGDILGATEQVGEALILLCAAAFATA